MPAAALAAPGNDDPANAQPVDLDQSVSGSNVGASAAGEPQPCGVTMDATVWYRVDGNGGPITLNTVGSDPDTVLAVYDTDSNPTEGDAIDCNNDIWDGGDNQDDRASEVVFDSRAGARYLVQVGTCSGCGSSLPATGGIDFVAFDAPGNDDRAAARPIGAGGPVLADNFGATTEAGERLECGADHPYGKTVWFRFTAPGSGTAVFSTGGGLDSVMAVYRGGTELGCNDDTIPHTAGPSQVSVHVDAGDYLVQVGGWGDDIRAAYDDFTVRVDFGGDPLPDSDGDGIPDVSDHCPAENSRARDADGDGCLDPAPLLSLRTTVSSTWDFTSHAPRTRPTVLAANALPAGSVVKVTCKAKRHKGCPPNKTYRIRKATKKRNLRKPFKHKLLRPRSVVTVTVTAPGYEGKVWRYTIRKKKKPKLEQLCLDPGAKRPSSCV
jgi:hypothetical protein